MYIKLTNGIVYDPVHGINGEHRDIYINDGQITRKPSSNTKICKTYDMKGKIIMAGAIDIHTHIGGGKVRGDAAVWQLREGCRSEKQTSK